MGLLDKLKAASGRESAPVENTGYAGVLMDTINWRTEKRRIGDLVEWENNPRRLTEKQAADLAASLAKFGYVEEIVVNADGRSMIGGHQRRRVLLAQALLNPDALVDVRIPSRPLSEAEGIELAIRLNRNTGEWDWDILANNFDDAALRDWGFTEQDFTGAFHEPEKAEAEKPAEDWKTPDGPFDVRDAAAEMADLLPHFDSVEQIVAQMISVPGARMQFNRLCAGERGSVGNRISLLFNPHRLSTATNRDVDPLSGFERANVREAIGLFLCRKGLSTESSFPTALYAGVGGMRCVNEFSPAVARDLWKQLLGEKTNVRVLDPCHGWGGRLIGWMALQRPGLYCGVDPSVRTSDGVRRLYKFLKASGVPGEAIFTCAPFEDAVEEPRTYDAVLTSPPYFDSELYAPGEDTQSRVRHPSLEAWRDNWLRMLVEKSIRALKPDGVAAINVGNNQHELGAAVAEFAMAAGAHVERSRLDIGGNRGELSGDSSVEGNTEELLLLRPTS